MHALIQVLFQEVFIESLWAVGLERKNYKIARKVDETSSYDFILFEVVHLSVGSVSF